MGRMLSLGDGTIANGKNRMPTDRKERVFASKINHEKKPFVIDDRLAVGSKFEPDAVQTKSSYAILNVDLLLSTIVDNDLLRLQKTSLSSTRSICPYV